MAAAHTSDTPQLQATHQQRFKTFVERLPVQEQSCAI